MSDRKALLKVTYEVRISSIFRCSSVIQLLYFKCVFFNTVVFDDIQYGASFEPFVERLSG
jgi:hypothetical protein